MSNNHSPDEPQNYAEKAFSLLGRGITRAPVNGASQANIARWVFNPTNLPQELRANIENAIRTDLGARRAYKQFLQSASQAMFAPAAAADSEVLTERKIDGAIITVKYSRADNQQCYVIATFDGDKAVATAGGFSLVMVAENLDLPVRLDFPPTDDGRAQIIAATNDPGLVQLMNKNSTIYLLPTR